VKISIVTPSLNQGRFIRKTAASILSQSATLEWIIADGGSSDETLAFLRTLADPRVSYFSEPDRGQAHAINKGLERATGDVVAWLNADDLYRPGALASVAQCLNEHPNSNWLVGGYQIIDEADRPIRSPVVRYKQARLRRYSYRALLRENFISQPAVFWRADFGRRIGPLDESLHFTMDYDLWLRMGRECDPLIANTILASFRLHPRSKSGSFDRRQFDEGYRVACRYTEHDIASRLAHRLHAEKIIWAYRALRLFGR
jgi:glycosyltransferase involved in cell wall biosynthesis